LSKKGAGEASRAPETGLPIFCDAKERPRRRELEECVEPWDHRPQWQAWTVGPLAGISPDFTVTGFAQQALAAIAAASGTDS